MTIESLKEQLASTEIELEQAKAHVHRCDGVIQLLRHLIENEGLPIDPKLPFKD